MPISVPDLPPGSVYYAAPARCGICLASEREAATRSWRDDLESAQRDLLDEAETSVKNWYEGVPPDREWKELAALLAGIIDKLQDH